MVVRHRNEANCFNPRDYQVELLDKACKRNIIVQLGTGSGKTFIAVLLLKEYGVQLHVPLENGGKRGFFIVEKVNLVEQQAEHIERHTTFRVGRVHGQLNNSLTRSFAECEKFLKEHQVIVITAQCLLDLIQHAFIKIETACVMIFDECHHALGSKHPFRLIMTEYKKHKSEGGETPRILGLTASLIKEKTSPATLEQKLNKLEAVMDCSIETASDLVNISKFGAKPYEAVVFCLNFDVTAIKGAPIDQCLNIIERVKRFIETTSEINPDLDLDPRRPIRDSLKTTLAVLEQLGPWTAWKMSQVWERELFKLAREKMLPYKATRFLRLAQTAMMTIRRLLEPIMKPIRRLSDLKRFIPHRMIRLFDLLEVYSPEMQASMDRNESLCAIVFVDQRYIAYALQIVLRQVRNWEPSMQFIKSDYVVGASGNSLVSNENQGLHKRQADVLRRFHRNELNVLIATSVLEEGVDVKQCNVVVKFDRPLDMRSFIQSKGRARRIGAKYAILVEHKHMDACNHDLMDFTRIEELLLHRCRSVHNPNIVDVDLDDTDCYMKPYIVESTGAIVRMSNAINLVNRYCGKLPSDIFTKLVPQNRIIPVDKGHSTQYCAELLLPINSPIKRSIRLITPMPSKKLAQMAVALEACKQLHAVGELDDNLMPLGRESLGQLLEHIDEEPDEYIPGMCAKVGSAKRKQLYDKKAARFLYECIVSPNSQHCYLYVLEMERLKEPEIQSNPKRRRFTNPHDYEYCFGFLSSKKLPKVPPFPIYLRQGDMRVRLVLSNELVDISKYDLNEIRQFHDYLFTQVLQLCKPGILEFVEEAPINTLIVPLNKNGTPPRYSINRDYITNVVLNMSNLPRIPKEEERKHFKFCADNYRDAIVMPWYRNVEQPAFYHVAEVLDDMRPSSQFPDENYTTFNEYFIKKYNITIYDQDQPLLDVDYSSNRLNLLLPRIQSKKASPSSTDLTASPSASCHSSQRQILVPELMDIHPMSATLWNSIAALPSIFYRLNQLLLADELRMIIMERVFKKDASVPDGLEWAPLTYPATYEEKQSMMVKKIQQLRQLEKQEEQPAEPEREDDFAIGVWDPEDAIRCGVEVMPLDRLDEKLADTSGLMTGLHDGASISDEEDENLPPFIMHDYKQKFCEKLNFEVPEETGWGEVDEIDESNTSNAPFEILNFGTNPINLRSLQEDIGRHVNAPDLSKRDEQMKLIMKACEKFDGNEKSWKEEIVDLEQFDDKEDEEPLRQRCAHSDDEFEELLNGEKKKLEDDRRALHRVKRGKKETIEGLNGEDVDLPFSFMTKSPKLETLQADEMEIHQDKLIGYGVSPCLLITALTTSNASDGISLERFETIGDSFLKFAVTDYLYHTHPEQHEGKLSFARSKEVSNCNLYRLGKNLGIPQLIFASKFDAHDSWLPPCYASTIEFKAPNTDDVEQKDNEMERILNGDKSCSDKKMEKNGWDDGGAENSMKTTENGIETITFANQNGKINADLTPLPYNLITQQNISDKSIADAMEALIGVHLLSLGPKATVKVMKWMGLSVLDEEKEVPMAPPLLRFIDTEEKPNASLEALENIWIQFQFGQLEETIGYTFHEKSYLVQAFTHSSYVNNRVTGCYQRLEFLGDAVLDYMITRYLFEDKRQYSPGVLTDLRSALVNNTIFASLAVKYGFQKHFIVMCPGLHHMIEKFVKLCADRNFDTNFNAEMYMVTTEEEIDEGQEEDVEVPKALGDIFESLAGAIYLDSGRNLDVTWKVIYKLIKTTIEECCANPPRSPIRELMELESSKARFSKMERIIESGKVRVTVDIGNSMRFTGMGRNYRIAKSTAAKRALKYIHMMEQQRRNKEVEINC